MQHQALTADQARQLSQACNSALRHLDHVGWTNRSALWLAVAGFQRFLLDYADDADELLLLWSEMQQLREVQESVNG